MVLSFRNGVFQANFLYFKHFEARRRMADTVGATKLYPVHAIAENKNWMSEDPEERTIVLPAELAAICNTLRGFSGRCEGKYDISPSS